MVPIHVLSRITTPCKVQFNLLNVNLIICIQVSKVHTSLQFNANKYKLDSPLLIAENLISNMHFLLLRNLESLWWYCRTNTYRAKFKPLTTTLLPQRKVLFQFSRIKPHAWCWPGLHTLHQSAPSNSRFVPSTPPLHLYRLEKSFKDFHKALATKCCCSKCSKRLLLGWRGEEELHTGPFPYSEQVKTKPQEPSLRGYYSRQGKYFGVALKSPSVSPRKRLINHCTLNEVHPLAVPPFLWTQA